MFLSLFYVNNFDLTFEKIGIEGDCINFYLFFALILYDGDILIVWLDKRLIRKREVAALLSFSPFARASNWDNRVNAVFASQIKSGFFVGQKDFLL